MSRLRCGDVVSREGSDQEMLVKSVSDLGTKSFEYVLFAGAVSWVPSGDLRLLRRPLQPGDTLRHYEVSSFKVEVVSVGETVEAKDLEDGHVFDLILDKWRHDDGTPIEHPELHQPQAVVPADEPSVTINLGGFGAPSPEVMARAFFDTDPEVLRVVRKAADAVCAKSRETETRLMYDGPNVTVTCTVEVEDEGRFERALDVAWRIDESGRRTFWLERAKAAHALLVGGSKQ